ncbi:hypothetical protein CMQ_3003 [Grosmannia clavigera kw1407]|uniref:Uncharacterized protein n=1 Tax=Grosmannia clavigera (strain kw1407 / UAMH 11150) TaxID=655863 RepID=F0XGN7_GROCL|nr:uncharacterized protein CMQ_3003 [Grosmannia clavigera kw1407]EFX03074.1 hypothetical protein CMQ_3003 [Grosmannia clavigera kw1407]
MPSGLFSFFRGAQPSATNGADGRRAPASSTTLTSQPDRLAGTKRQTEPPESGRTAAAVKGRWKQLANEHAARKKKSAAAAAKRASSGYASWLPRFRPPRFAKSEPIDCAASDSGAMTTADVHEKPQPDGGRALIDVDSMIVDTVVVNTGLPTDGMDETDDERYEYTDEADEANEADEADAASSCVSEGEYDADSCDDVLSCDMFPTPRPAKGPRLGSLAANLATLNGGGSELTASARDGNGQQEEGEEEEEDELDDYEDEDADEDGRIGPWSDLLEEEPDSDTESEWEVDEDELSGYESEVGAIAGFASWTHDEKKLHRLMSLRGFHPLMPAIWSRDFLGVPMYPSLFAPPDRPDKPTLISNKSSQFRATKALRSLFDLQVRVSGLRQAGNTRRIDIIIEKELQRYIAWAAEDAGLDRCAPFAAMPNITAKRFSKASSSSSSSSSSTRKSGRPGSPQSQRASTRKWTLARRIQDYFRAWATQYREYYASLPPFAEADAGDDAVKEEDDDVGTSRCLHLRRLRPPRMLYGFVIVQHVVMLLAVDAARPRARPRCFADFNMSLGGHWLDASLSVAIPVHLARAAQLRAARGLALPVRLDLDEDEDM